MPANWENSAVATGLEKVSFIPIPKKGNAKECSNYCTIGLISHASTETVMAPHSSTLAWKIPWTEEPGGPQSMGSLRVGHNSMTSLSLFTFMHWRKKWQPTLVFLPGESHGQRSLEVTIHGVARVRHNLVTKLLLLLLEHSFALPFFGIGMKTDLFQSCGHC